MGDPETCGHETAAGTPCQHPTTDDGDPDRCWVETHNDSDGARGGDGRSWAIDDADHEDILEAARLGASKAGCARAAGVGKASLERYLDAHEEFRNAFTRARARGEQRLLDGALFHDENAERHMNGQHARFILASSFDYKKTEKHEVTGEDGGAIDVNLNRTVVGSDE